MEQFQLSNGQGIRVLNSNGQNIQIIQQSDASGAVSTSRPATIQQATLNGQPVLLQIVNQAPGENQTVTGGQVINVPVTSKIETPKKRPLEATLAVAPTVQSVQPAIQSQTLNRHGGLNTSIMSQGSNGGNASFHDLNGPAAKRARLARGGLRICAKDVCDKVFEKGRTTYFEVANEIVGDSLGTGDVDEKNLKRRVYDALNVLMALNIVHKERNKEKTISWVGLPTSGNSEQKSHLQTEKLTLQRRVKHKEGVLRELLLQHVAFKRLLERNRKNEEEKEKKHSKAVVQLPFIVVNMSRETKIDCSISEDQFEYHIKFNKCFELHDELEILKLLGLADPQNAELMLPKKLRHYLSNEPQMGGSSALSASMSSRLSSNHSIAGSDSTTMNSSNNDHQVELVEICEIPEIAHVVKTETVETSRSSD
ncbi:Oidioi.mRNA.OKI2018_I69.chr2.g7901.t1.cds [Oikopleura dioica]|uniref:Oidioi.mRNA.OKI2018_I69.chr2.g7901.t1.cds n=1 Tax=Oikopleura dioica TaxID=34765 RepID=A0ABN7T7M8_OIKDI|nr:Oidioi.mRNA.OKI2018_I69.chr2.g7901.t1.cds [Oikopleura dioica]